MNPTSISYLLGTYYMYNTVLGIIGTNIDIHCMTPAYELVRKIRHKTKVKKKCKYLITCALKNKGYLGVMGKRIVTF